MELRHWLDWCCWLRLITDDESNLWCTDSILLFVAACTRLMRTMRKYWQRSVTDCERLTRSLFWSTSRRASRSSWTWKWKNSKSSKKTIMMRRSENKRESQRRITWTRRATNRTWQRRVRASWVVTRHPASMSRCSKSTKQKFAIISRSSSSSSYTSNACKTSWKTRRSLSRRRSKAKKKSKLRKSSSWSVTRTCLACAKKKSANWRVNLNKCASTMKVWKRESIILN